ncbi:unnamed protein product [Linum trigynum]|uniref:DUF6821 domain-containing protein n=1 Tax=Linum trigynum TaxID=586398 RepID=A0AAV2CK65_9ROSI
MDLEEWEVLPRDASFFDFHDDGGARVSSSPAKSSSRRGSSSTSSPSYSCMSPNYSVLDMNYFICPSSPPKSSISRVVLPIELEPTDHPSPPQEEQQLTDCSSSRTRMMMVIPKISKAPSFTGSVAVGCGGGDQDSVSQVFFKKMKENEFVDMKLDSPKSPTMSSPPSSLLSSPKFGAGKFSFEDNGATNDPSLEKDEIGWDEGSGKDGDSGGGGLNIWRWSLHGVGAICSFGVAAATVCIIIFGNHQRNQQHKREQQIRFQIYTDDKRVKQVVQHATRFNDAISAVRGVPIARAQVTFGGYYDGI